MPEMDVKEKKEVDEMFSLTEFAEEQGKKEGIKKGIKKGIRKGERRGITKGEINKLKDLIRKKYFAGNPLNRLWINAKLQKRKSDRYMRQY